MIADECKAEVQDREGASACAADTGVKQHSSNMDSLEVSEQRLLALIDSDVGFRKTKVSDVAGSFRWAPFIPLTNDHSLLALLLLVSRYRIRTVPIVEVGHGPLANLITQSSVLRLLAGCSGLPWFDAVAGRQLAQLGLPAMTPDKMVVVRGGGGEAQREGGREGGRGGEGGREGSGQAGTEGR